MKGCIKPNCDCIEKAIEANGGQELKNGYPCLHCGTSELEKSANAFNPNNYSKFLGEQPEKEEGTVEDYSNSEQEKYLENLRLNRPKYSEQEVIEIIEKVLKRASEYAQQNYNLTIDKQSILSTPYTDLLKK